MSRVADQIKVILSDYADAYVCIGYDLNGESFMIRAFETEKDQAALHALLEGVLNLDDEEVEE